MNIQRAPLSMALGGILSLLGIEVILGLTWADPSKDQSCLDEAQCIDSEQPGGAPFQTRFWGDTKSNTTFELTTSTNQNGEIVSKIKQLTFVREGKKGFQVTEKTNGRELRYGAAVSSPPEYDLFDQVPIDKLFLRKDKLLIEDKDYLCDVHERRKTTVPRTKKGQLQKTHLTVVAWQCTSEAQNSGFLKIVATEEEEYSSGKEFVHSIELNVVKLHESHRLGTRDIDCFAVTLVERGRDGVTNELRQIRASAVPGGILASEGKRLDLGSGTWRSESFKIEQSEGTDSPEDK